MTEQPPGGLAGLRSHRWFVHGVVGAAVLVILAVVLVPRILFALSHATTDDAFVDGTIVPVSAEVAGKALRVLVEDHARVAAGQPLLEIAPDDYASAVAAREAALVQARAEVAVTAAQIDQGGKDVATARARLASAQAQAELARTDQQRYANLLAKGSAAQGQYDNVATALRLAEAQQVAAASEVASAEAALRSRRATLDVRQSEVASAEVALRIAQRNLGRTTVNAPIAGTVADRNVDPGKYVAVGQPLFALVRTDSVWVTANFKETQIHNMRVGMPATLDVDAYPGVTFHGHVQSFEPATGAVMSLLPPDNATGNFIKTTQRVPVRIALERDADPARRLWPGLSVTVHVDVSAAPSARDSSHAG